MATQHLFVYGTLRRDIDPQANGMLDEQARFVEQATFQGRLYDLGDYPGLVASHDPNDQVSGELYALLDPESLLPQLDQYEGYLPAAPRRSLYVRQERYIRRADGQRRLAWIYLYNRPVTGYPLIPSGDYARYLQTDE